jgi:hypothetical protein
MGTPPPVAVPPLTMTSIPPTPVTAAVSPGLVLPYGELQHAATYLAVVRMLRVIGIGNIVWGAVLMIIGLLSAIGSMTWLSGSDSSTVMLLAIGAVIGALGLAFIGEGVWLIAKPSANGLLVAAITMFVTGVVCLRGILALIVFIAYGLALLKRHKKYGPVMTHRPSEAMLRQAGELLDKLLKAARKKSPDIIEILTATVFMKRRWRGLLLDDLAILASHEARIFGYTIADIYFLPPNGFSIEITGKSLTRRWLKGVLVVDNTRHKGRMLAESYQRYQAWLTRYQPFAGPGNAGIAPPPMVAPPQ